MCKKYPKHSPNAMETNQYQNKVAYTKSPSLKVIVFFYKISLQFAH